NKALVAGKKRLAAGVVDIDAIDVGVPVAQIEGPLLHEAQGQAGVPIDVVVGVAGDVAGVTGLVGVAAGGGLIADQRADAWRPFTSKGHELRQILREGSLDGPYIA